MKKDIHKKQLRDFGLLFGIGLPVIIGFLIPTITGHALKFWTIWFGTIVLTFGIFKPSLLYYPYKFWILLGYKLGWINSHIILGLIFILVLQPIALIMKLFGYDPLRKKRNSNISYREDKDNNIDLTRIF